MLAPIAEQVVVYFDNLFRSLFTDAFGPRISDLLRRKAVRMSLNSVLRAITAALRTMKFPQSMRDFHGINRRLIAAEAHPCLAPNSQLPIPNYSRGVSAARSFFTFGAIT